MTALLLPTDLAIANSSFSHQLPGMQLAVDSTSLGEFKVCPRRYYYTIIWGWQSKEENVHFRFGIAIHEAREQYDLARADGQDHDEALAGVLKVALERTWNRELQRPWISGHPSKNRLSIIRSIVWYLDAYGSDDPLQTVHDASGRPLVELSFRFDSGFATAAGESLLLCGHGDRIGVLNGDPYWVDTKTTTDALDGRYFAKYNPHNQFSLYHLAGKVVYKVPTRGVILDALQVGATFTRAKRHLVARDDAQDAEWLSSFGWWARQMEYAASTRDWPMNDRSCDQYGGCQFRSICSKSPASRETWLAAGFRRRVWDPLQRRGDI
jgi:PD-(D/E)XK nuclease superfamily protein